MQVSTMPSSWTDPILLNYLRSLASSPYNAIVNLWQCHVQSVQQNSYLRYIPTRTRHLGCVSPAWEEVLRHKLSMYNSLKHNKHRLKGTPSKEASWVLSMVLSKEMEGKIPAHSKFFSQITVCPVKHVSESRENMVVGAAVFTKSVTECPECI